MNTQDYFKYSINYNHDDIIDCFDNMNELLKFYKNNNINDKSSDYQRKLHSLFFQIPSFSIIHNCMIHIQKILKIITIKLINYY